MGSGRLADYLGKGAAADRPVTLDLHPEAVGFYYATDTEEWSAWDGSTWQSVAGGGGSPQDLQSVLDTGNVGSPEQGFVLQGELASEDAETVFSVSGFKTTLDFMGSIPLELTFGGLASTVERVGVSALTVSFPLPEIMGGANYYDIQYPYGAGTLVLDTQLAAATGAAGIGYDNITSGLAATTVQAAVDEIAEGALAVVTEATAFTADPAVHAGVHRYIRAGGDVTFDSGEGYGAGQVFNIRATDDIELVEDGVTLSPNHGGTLEMEEGMAVTIVMTSPTTADIIGQTVPA